MNEKLRRLIDLEIEEFILDGTPLPIKQEVERDQLLKEIEAKLNE